MTRRPNILFVFADQLRGSSLGHVVQEPVLTPNIDRFASQGVRFTRAVSNAPLCCPMRASLITGQHPLSHGVLSNDIPLRQDAPSVGKSLSEAGYYTGYIGKWHLDGPDRSCFTPPGPRRQGFQYWAASNCNHNYMASYYYQDTAEPVWNEGYEPEAQTELALQFLAEAKQKDKPFCLFLSWGPPHCPYDQVPDEFMRLYDPESLEPRRNAVNPNMKIVAGYYAHISALDWNFGRIMDGLDALGLADDTLVIFTSDHGDMLFSQGRGWKWKPWQESVIVPFIARWPGAIPAGSVEDAPFGLVNTAPTLISLCGIDVPAEIEGEVLPHLLLQMEGDRPESTPIYNYLRFVNTDPWRGIVTRTHTYARFRDEPWILYDDACDPYQMQNLTQDPACSRLQRTLETQLQEWLFALGDSFDSAPELASRYGITTGENGVPPYYDQPHIYKEMMSRLRAWKGRDHAGIPESFVE